MQMGSKGCVSSPCDAPSGSCLLYPSARVPGDSGLAIGLATDDTSGHEGVGWEDEDSEEADMDHTE